MATARDIITSALTFRLNRLSPGETLDADTAATCLAGLRDVIDGINGLGAFLFREVLISGVCNGVSGTLGTTWPSMTIGQSILGATVSYQAGMEIPLLPISMEQYAEISQKATASIPQFYAHDGASTVYFWPAAAGQTITLRTRQDFMSFADLDTDYGMPSGYPSAFGALLAELLAPVMVGGVSPALASAAGAARRNLGIQSCRPGIIDATRRISGNILTGFN